MKKIILFMLVAAVLVTGCTEQKPITELSFPGQGNQVYTFTNDIRQSLAVKTNDPAGIENLSKYANGLNFIYDGSNVTDNAYFQVLFINIAAKLPVYYSYQGRLFRFYPYYYLNDTWYDPYSHLNETLYNETGGNMTKPDLSGPTLWLIGPSAANETSLTLVNNTIYLRGADYKGLTLAGDKLTLLFFGIDDISKVAH